MEDLVVGHGPLMINELVKEMESEGETFAILCQNWKEFALRLGVIDVELLELERKLKLGDLNLKLIPREIIKIWKADNGTCATLKQLNEALVECEFKKMAETLLSKFIKLESLQMPRFIWRKQLFKLEEMLGNDISRETCKRIFQELKKNPFQETLQLIKQELTSPALPNYYVSRTLFCLSSKELDTKLFTSALAQNNIFLFKGISLQGLAKLTGYKTIDTSGNQLHNVSVSFIEMEHDKDFDRISRSTPKPIHLIQHENGSYYWVKSDKNLDAIKHFVKDHGKNMSEMELVSSVMSIPPPFALSIADSPGMGKTLILANLATKIQQEQPKSIVLFIVLQEFVEQTLLVNSSLCALEAIAEYSSCDLITKIVLLEMFNKSDDYTLTLFLDGYDEVMQEKLDEVDTFLKHVQEAKNVKVIVTTRPHLRTRLELIFNEFSYEILPFNETTQVDFLIRYWIERHESKESTHLKDFAEQCIGALQSKFSDTEKAIAGIPLQCMMLAEVYAEDANKICSSACHRKIKPISFFEMYKKLVDLKFRKIEDPGLRQNYLNAHVYEAVTLLFPNWSNSFKTLLKGIERVNASTMYAIGIIERSPNENSPRFIHRTFAEYLLAEFIVKNLENHEACIGIFFGEIFGRKGTRSEVLVPFVHKDEGYLEDNYYELNFPVISYFIDLHMREYAKHHCVNVELPLRLLRSWLSNLYCVDVITTYLTCCINDLESVLDYVTNILNNYGLRFFYRDIYFRDLPHIVVRSSNNVSMLEKAFYFIKTQFGVNYSNCTLTNLRSFSWNGREINDGTPLHSAILMGKYNMAAFLAEKLGKLIHDYRRFMHVCVQGSVGDSETMILSRLLIIDMLVGINPNWLEEKDGNDSMPLLEDAVHLSLLQRLLEHGADINGKSSVYGTILHVQFRNCRIQDIPHIGYVLTMLDLEEYIMTKTKFTTKEAYSVYRQRVFNGTNKYAYSRSHETVVKRAYVHLVRWTLSNGFYLINQADKWGRTPLITAIEAFGSVEEEVLVMFQKAGADFNARDENGNSVLFYAFGHLKSKNFDFINTLLDYGADLYHLNNRQQNIVHYIINYSKEPESEGRGMLISILKFLESQGFNQFNQKDSEGHTLFELAHQKGMQDDKELLIFLGK